MGWRYEWVGSLPRDVYDILLAMLNADADRARAIEAEDDELDDHGINRHI